MKQNGGAIRRISEIMTMSAQPLPGVPIIELAGDSRVLIENHRGVIEYEKERISILVKFGKLVIQGSDLRICCMSRHQLVINGTIHNLQIEKGCDG